MVLVTRQAPDFTAAAVLGSGEIVENFNFKQHTNGKTTVLFFWPMDFTFVCPSELIDMNHAVPEPRILRFLKRKNRRIRGGTLDQT